MNSLLNPPPFNLEGERACLLPLEAHHAKALWEVGAYPEIWAYMPTKVQDLQGMEAYVTEALTNRENGTEFPFVIYDKEAERIVGSTRFLDITTAHRNLEIGFTWHTPEVWRTRINTECKYLLLRYCFETLSLLRVQLKTDSRNERSQRAMERFGAVREGVLRKHRILSDGYVRDSVYYSVISEEWEAVKARLEGFLSR